MKSRVYKSIATSFVQTKSAQTSLPLDFCFHTNTYWMSLEECFLSNGRPQTLWLLTGAFAHVAMNPSAVSVQHKITWKARLFLLLLDTFSRNVPTTLAQCQETTRDLRSFPFIISI